MKKHPLQHLKGRPLKENLQKMLSLVEADRKERSKSHTKNTMKIFEITSNYVLNPLKCDIYVFILVLHVLFLSENVCIKEFNSTRC